LKVHTVQKGDSLWKISKMHGVALDELIAANPQIANPNQLEEGMQVNIPTGETTTAAEGEAANPNGMSVEMPMQQETVPTPAYPSVPKWDGLWKYVVKQGDSMFKIAKQVGVTLDQLKAANPQIADPEMIYPGQVLNIPSSGHKPKNSNPGHNLGHTMPMTKEQLTAPLVQQPMMTKEQITMPKEMAPMEKPMMPAPIVQQPQVSPIEMNIQYAPHLQYAPHEEHTQVQQQVMMQQPPAHQPVHHHVYHPVHHPHYMMMYIPVSKKKKHKCKCYKCHKKHKCGHKHHHDHHHHDHHEHMMAYHHHLHMQQMQQMQHMHHMQPGMGMMPTFYREED
jgi:morphogenetic protein associated with SpoVID